MIREFEKQRHRANQFCPCGKSNKDGKFVTEKGYIGQPIGYCHSCDKSFSKGKSVDLESYYKKPVTQIYHCKSNWQQLETHFDVDLKSDFVKYLVKTFGEEQTIEAVEKYFLGYFDSWHESQDQKTDVIFWQIDRNTNVRAGKIMSYNDKGKRYGNPYWIHKINNESCQLNQCFFGEHLIDQYDLPIAVVEGGKCAVIMSIIRPDYIWLSSEGQAGLSINKCESIKEFDVTLYPDHNAYEGWSRTAEKYDFEISRDAEIWFEKGLIEKGEAIDDYYLRNHSKTLKPRIEYYDPEWANFIKEHKASLKTNKSDTLKKEKI